MYSGFLLFYYKQGRYRDEVFKPLSQNLYKEHFRETGRVTSFGLWSAPEVLTPSVKRSYML